jgi:hypothetical protein
MAEFKFDPNNLRVGRAMKIKGKWEYSSYEGFEPIIILTKDSPYGSLSPYVLKSEAGVIMENDYQFDKIYPVSPAHNERNHPMGPIIWTQPQEVHVDEKGILTPEFFAWRKRGKNLKNWVRYPCGRKNMHLCRGSYLESENRVIGYIESRIKTYATLYIEEVRIQAQFLEIIEKLKAGKKLLILETDGPVGTSLPYYKEKYKVGDDFIVGNTMIATPENINIMLYDEKEKFGHGYACAWGILLYFGMAGILPELKLK